MRYLKLVLPVLIGALLLASSSLAWAQDGRIFVRFDAVGSALDSLEAARSRFDSAVLEYGDLEQAGSVEMEGVFAECREQVGVAADEERRCRLQAARRLSVEQVVEIKADLIKEGLWELQLVVWAPDSNSMVFSSFVELEGAELKEVARAGLPLLARKYLCFRGQDAACDGGALAELEPEREMKIVERKSRKDSPTQDLAAQASDTEAALLTPKAPAHLSSPPAQASYSITGLAWTVSQAGHGSHHPGLKDTVLVHYSGWDSTGKLLDSSVARGEPTRFPVNAVIPGFAEALQDMVEGERRMVWIPEALAYEGKANMPAGMLIFEIELISIEATHQAVESW